jgi:hypothetical protein
MMDEREREIRERWHEPDPDGEDEYEDVWFLLSLLDREREYRATQAVRLLKEQERNARLVEALSQAWVETERFATADDARSYLAALESEEADPALD